MNEYINLINYLNFIIEQVNNKKLICNQNIIIKQFIEDVISKIDSFNLIDINIDLFDKLLCNFISEVEIKNIEKKILELSIVQSFLQDERVLNPIKDIMIRDLYEIINMLKSLCSEIDKTFVSSEEIDLQNQCIKYLNIVNENGYTRVLSDDEREKFLIFLKNANLEDSFLLAFNYVNYAYTHNNSSSKKEKLNTRVNYNKKNISSNLSINYEEVYENITELLDLYNNINMDTYDAYKKYFMKLDVYEIYSRRGIFLSIDGVNWEVAIPCIKERLLPYINSNDKALIYKIFNEIIALSTKELDDYHEVKRRDNEYKKKLLFCKNKFESVMDDAKKLRRNLSEVIKKVNERTRKNVDSINALMEIYNLNEIGSDDLLEHYGVTIDELKLYKFSEDIQMSINEVSEIIKLELLSDSDFEYIYYLIDDIKSKIDECSSMFDLFNTTVDNSLEDVSSMQYEYGESVIVFFRRDEASKFLIEEDMNKQSIDERSYNDIVSILKTVSDTTSENWGKSGQNHFKSFVNYNKQNGNKGDVVTIESDYTHTIYSLFRLKNKGKTYSRLSAIDIDMCTKNREKVNIPNSKHIILIIGEKQVMKFSNESQEYADVIREFKNNFELIKKYIELFENPNTNSTVLYEILNDSSNLYNSFKTKTRVLGG